MERGFFLQNWRYGNRQIIMSYFDSFSLFCIYAYLVNVSGYIHLLRMTNVSSMQMLLFPSKCIKSSSIFHIEYILLQLFHSHDMNCRQIKTNDLQLHKALLQLFGWSINVYASPTNHATIISLTNNIIIIITHHHLENNIILPKSENLQSYNIIYRQVTNLSNIIAIPTISTISGSFCMQNVHLITSVRDELWG